MQDPTYNFRCKKCNHEWEVGNITKNQVFDVYDEPCPGCGTLGQIEKWVPNPDGNCIPSIGDPVRLGIRKVDKGFNELIHKIHENTPGSQLHKSAHF